MMPDWRWIGAALAGAYRFARHFHRRREPMRDYAGKLDEVLKRSALFLRVDSMRLFRAFQFSTVSSEELDVEASLDLSIEFLIRIGSCRRDLAFRSIHFVRNPGEEKGPSMQAAR